MPLKPTSTTVMGTATTSTSESQAKYQESEDSEEQSTSTNLNCSTLEENDLREIHESIIAHRNSYPEKNEQLDQVLVNIITKQIQQLVENVEIHGGDEDNAVFRDGRHLQKQNKTFKDQDRGHTSQRTSYLKTAESNKPFLGRDSEEKTTPTTIIAAGRKRHLRHHQRNRHRYGGGSSEEKRIVTTASTTATTTPTTVAGGRKRHVRNHQRNRHRYGGGSSEEKRIVTTASTTTTSTTPTTAAGGRKRHMRNGHRNRHRGGGRSSEEINRGGGYFGPLVPPFNPWLLFVPPTATTVALGRKRAFSVINATTTPSPRRPPKVGSISGRGRLPFGAESVGIKGIKTTLSNNDTVIQPSDPIQTATKKISDTKERARPKTNPRFKPLRSQ
ncbi:hypothetical protein Btru_072640 [Bulinus truncatus]|nr:hypothetical protein Btru_072640 [Bulinus truncatus]